MGGSDGNEHHADISPRSLMGTGCGGFSRTHGSVFSDCAAALGDAGQYPRLKEYVHGVVGAFAKDERILAWDVWNEPGSHNAGSYGKEELKDKIARVTVLLPQVFAWAREANPVQPLTSGVWAVDTSPDGANLGELHQIQ